MGRRPANKVEKVTNMLLNASFLAGDLPFNHEVSTEITTELWKLHDKIERLELERKQKEIMSRKQGSIKTFVEPPIAEVIRVTGHTIAILCPYCGEKHIHGNIPGHVMAHCLELMPGNRGYIIPEAPS